MTLSLILIAIGTLKYKTDYARKEINTYYYDMTPVQRLEDSCTPCSIEGLSIYEHLTLQKIEGFKRRISELQRKGINKLIDVISHQIFSCYGGNSCSSRYRCVSFG